MPRIKKQKLKRRKDGYYVCRYKDQYFWSKDPDDALRQRDEYKQQEKAGYISQLFVKEYAEKWLIRAHPDVSPSTITGLKIHLRKLLNVIGDFYLDEVKPSDIKQVYSDYYIGKSNSYIKAGKQLFCSLFDAAQADGIIRTNPARNAKPHRGTTGSHRAITDQERTWIETLCTDHRFHAVAVVMLYTGIRPQEAKALTIEKAYDPDNEVLHITETAHRNGSNQYVINKKMKTEHSIRDIPVFPPVENVLKGKKGLLITSAKGKQITATTWRNAFDSYKCCMETAINGMEKRWYGRTKEHKKILADGGSLPAWIEFTVVPYDLRHSFCTWGRDHGVELHTMIEWMGHADAKMIMKIYDEVSDNRSRIQAKMLLKSAFGGVNGGETESKDQETPIK